MTHLSYLLTLESLYLRFNKISGLSFVEKLTNLQSLYLRYNNISDLSFVEKLTNLQSLDLRSNIISDSSPLLFLIKKGIPVQWEQDYNNGIYVENNPWESPSIEIMKQGNAGIISYFESLDKGKNVIFKEIKILLIGEGMAGKTSLLKQFKGLPFDKHESQTHGINIESLSLGKLKSFKKYSKMKGVTAHFWDFGGQEIMHASHQFFMTKRSVYLLLIDSRTDAKKEYWLQHIQKYGGNTSPLCVIINKIDENKSYNVEQRTLNQKYPLIKNRFFRISCKIGTGFEELVSEIAQIIPKTALYGTKVREEWISVKEALEAETDAQNYLDKAAFSTICERNKVTDKTEQVTLLNFLHELSVVLHFEKLALNNFYVLDPLWLTVGVYNIINSHEIPDGLLLESKLDYILNKEKTKKEEYDPAKAKKIIYDVAGQAYLIKIMQQFELLYEFEEGRYLVPDLLPKESKEMLSIDEKNEEHIHFVFEYDFLPNSIFSRFIIRMREDISNLEELWRTGLVLKNDNFRTKALVRADKEEKRIYICVEGDSLSKRDYFAVIRHNLWSINNSFNFKKEEIKQLIPVPGHPKFEIDYEELLGFEKAGKDEYFIGKLGKEFSVSRDFLDKVVSKSERMKEHQIINQTFNFKGKNPNVVGYRGNPVPVVKAPITVAPPPKKWQQKWWVERLFAALGAGIFGAIGTAWFTNFHPFSGFYIVFALLTAILLYLGNPDRRFFRMAKFSLGSAISLFVLQLGFSLQWVQKIEDGKIKLALEWLSEHDWLIAIVLIVLAGFLFYLDWKKSEKE